MVNDKTLVTKITKTHSMSKLKNHPFMPIVLINNARINLLIKLVGDLENKTLTDVGCESGLTISEILKSQNPKKIFAVDLSSYALSNAKKLASKEGWFDKTEFIECDAQKIALKDNISDVVVSSNVLEHLENPQEGFNELVRIAKKNGKIIVHVPNEKKIIACKKFLHSVSPKSLGHLQIITPGHIHYPDRKFIKNLIKHCPYKVKLLKLRSGPVISIIGLYLYAVLQKFE